MKIVTTDNTVTQEALDIDAVTAQLLLLRHKHALPRAIAYEITTAEHCSFTGIYVYVSTAADVAAWAGALGVERDRGRILCDDGTEIYDATADDWHGWYVRVVANVRTGGVTDGGLDAETVAELEQIAGAEVPA